MNIPLIIMKGEYGAIDTADSLCHGYYIITFSSSTFTLETDLSIDGQVISPGNVLCEVNYFFPINIIYYYSVFTKNQIH